MTSLSYLISDGRTVLIWTFIVTQALYLASILLIGFFFTWPIDLVEPEKVARESAQLPPVVLFYPVLRELEETMRTTFHALDQIDYPRDKWRIVAIPNHDDHTTIASLQHLQLAFPWLEILPIPPTSHPSWNVVWREWERNPKVYWWHEGKRARVRDLPPKKTRQLIYAFYNLCPVGAEDTLISYIDADSAPAPNYFLLGAAGAAQYDVVQLTNVAANVLSSWASSFHAFDHMCWDASMYAHMSAHGKHPFYVLGKGLFFRSSDLHAFGGFHPWLTIEDPEVGMRLWTNGRRLGVVRQPLVEEVPATFSLGVTQRKRWVCGFFQSLGNPLKQMGMTWTQRQRARLNLIPSVALLVNPLGIAAGLAVLGMTIAGDRLVDRPLAMLCAVNVLGVCVILAHNWLNCWRVSTLVLDNRRDRLRLAFRLNPLFVVLYWLFWSVSIAIGIQMFVRDKGLVWERTVKVDANHDFVRESELVGVGNSEQRMLENGLADMRKRDLAGAVMASPGHRLAMDPVQSQIQQAPRYDDGGSVARSARPNNIGGSHRYAQYRDASCVPFPCISEEKVINRVGRHRRTQYDSNHHPVLAVVHHETEMSNPRGMMPFRKHSESRRSDAVDLTGQMMSGDAKSQLSGLMALIALSNSERHVGEPGGGADTVPSPRAEGSRFRAPGRG